MLHPEKLEAAAELPDGVRELIEQVASDGKLPQSPQAADLVGQRGEKVVGQVELNQRRCERCDPCRNHLDGVVAQAQDVEPRHRDAVRHQL